MLYSCVPNQNKEWNVPQSLEMLNSIINNTLASIHSMDKVNHMKADDDRKKVFLSGHIICASILAAYSAEIALKTLIAQVYPKKHPTSLIDNTKDKHNLLCLFNILPSTNQNRIEEIYQDMPAISNPDWRSITENKFVKSILERGADDFVKFRYSMENPVNDSESKGLISVAVATMIATQELVAGTNFQTILALQLSNNPNFYFVDGNSQ